VKKQTTSVTVVFNLPLKEEAAMAFMKYFLVHATDVIDAKAIEEWFIVEVTGHD